MIYRLGDSPGAPFPPDDLALKDPNGLLAWGGDLSAERLLAAYARGIFPWYSEPPILWWSPAPRACLYPDKMHISRRLRRLLRQGAFTLSCDRAFSDVIQHCAAPRTDDPDDEGWITPEMITAFIRLNELGHAHSVEVWQDGALAGGLYGVALGKLFFAESMVSLKPNASKVALASLCQTLHRSGFLLIDCQIENPHLMTLGVELLNRRSFNAILNQGLSTPCPVDDWSRLFEEPLKW